MINDVKTYLLLARVHTGAGTHTKVADVLQKAHDLQNSVLVKIKGEHADVLREQRRVAATIDFSLAEYYHTHNNLDKAQIFYNEALRHDETHEQSILALAKLYLSRGELDPCQHQCITLLRYL
jgi:tetratricopeptide repeat protein 21B